LGAEHWFLFYFGGAFSLIAAALFAFTLHHGLHRHRWWPMTLVVAVWLALVITIVGWDSEGRRSDGRRRAEELVTRAETGLAPDCLAPITAAGSPAFASTERSPTSAA
jgi:hypothetical protein